MDRLFVLFQMITTVLSCTLWGHGVFTAISNGYDYYHSIHSSLYKVVHFVWRHTSHEEFNTIFSHIAVQE